MFEAIGLQQGFGSEIITSIFSKQSSSLLDEDFPKVKQKAPDVNSLQMASRFDENFERRRETRDNRFTTEREVIRDIPVPAPKRTVEVIANFIVSGRGEMPPLDDNFVYFDE
jgi:hypothetical protein